MIASCSVKFLWFSWWDKKLQDKRRLVREMNSTYYIPRIVTAALKGGAGKTLISIGIIAALRNRGYRVAAFKKGPDYIDAAWLGLAAGGRCFNLDRYLFDVSVIRSSFEINTMGRQVAVVEGNRGLFDGVDARGTYSTADLARILDAPVLLIIDATKVTRTASAMVLGCRLMESGLCIGGVILNRVAGARHRKILTEAIEKDAAIPVIGSLEKLAWANLPQRHLGVLPLYEHPDSLQFLREVSHMIEQSIDLDSLMTMARSAPQLQSSHCSHRSFLTSCVSPERLKIGVIRDSAFQFYYPENLDALRSQGAHLIEISSLKPAELPDVHALYIGGGFPETHALQLARNDTFKTSLRKAVEEGLPVYAECGGLMYLCESLRMDDETYPMANIIAFHATLHRKPQGLGYVTVQVAEPNPFYAVNTILTGHEFHYSSISPSDNQHGRYAFRVVRGHGIDGKNDGIVYRNVLATYVHVHAAGEPKWATGLMEAAYRFLLGRDHRSLTVQ